ncbi:RHS repeat-associated core domain-containing protein [Flavobacterium cupriresistens]|nr:RHS repeat-associated core domain-containing protein [Flavobacterium sp. F-323]
MLVPNRHKSIDDYRYGFNGKEKDDEIKGGEGNHYDYGFRVHDPRVGRFFSVDPLAEKYAGVSSYAYVLNNPIIFIDPDGRDVLPWYVRSVLPNGTGKFEYQLSTRHLINAMKDFMKTSYGGNFISQFMKKNQNAYGYTAKNDGKYSKHDLNIVNVNIENAKDKGAYMTAEGSFDVIEKSKGVLSFTMYINEAGDKAGNGETIAHEAGLHGFKVDEIIKVYNEAGMDAVEKLRANNSGGSRDHAAIKKNDMTHGGVKIYHQVENELIKLDPTYKKTFEGEKKLYGYQY